MKNLKFFSKHFQNFLKKSLQIVTKTNLKLTTNPSIISSKNFIKSYLKMISDRIVEKDLNPNSEKKSTLIRVKHRMRKGVIAFLQRVVPQKYRMTRNQRQTLETSKELGINCDVIEIRGSIAPVISWLIPDVDSNEDTEQAMVETNTRDSDSNDEKPEPDYEVMTQSENHAISSSVADSEEPSDLSTSDESQENSLAALNQVSEESKELLSFPSQNSHSEELAERFMSVKKRPGYYYCMADPNDQLNVTIGGYEKCNQTTPTERTDQSSESENISINDSWEPSEEVCVEFNLGSEDHNKEMLNISSEDSHSFDSFPEQLAERIISLKKRPGYSYCIADPDDQLNVTIGGYEKCNQTTPTERTGQSSESESISINDSWEPSQEVCVEFILGSDDNNTEVLSITSENSHSSISFTDLVHRLEALNYFPTVEGINGQRLRSGSSAAEPEDSLDIINRSDNNRSDRLVAIDSGDEEDIQIKTVDSISSNERLPGNQTESLDKEIDSDSESMDEISKNESISSVVIPEEQEFVVNTCSTISVWLSNEGSGVSDFSEDRFNSLSEWFSQNHIISDIINWVKNLSIDLLNRSGASVAAPEEPIEEVVENEDPIEITPEAEIDRQCEQYPEPNDIERPKVIFVIQ